MFNYSKAELAEKAKELNFIRDTLEKVVRLTEILGYINSNPLMKRRLALKGGTAINLTVFRLPRLSVDIDLDYCADVGRDEMLAQRSDITNDLTLYMQTQGYSLSPQSKNRHSLDSFVFTYTNLGGMRDNIKVEINYSLRCHLFELKEATILTDVIYLENSITVLPALELFAAKINALLSRTAARDLYDTYNMIQLRLFDENELTLLRKAVVFYTAISQEEIPKAYEIDTIDRITMRKIRADLLPVIQKGEFIELEQIKADVKTFLSKLLVTTEREREFLELFSQKEYRPELLFDDSQIINRIQKHPMVLWKMQ